LGERGPEDLEQTALPFAAAARLGLCRLRLRQFVMRYARRAIAASRDSADMPIMKLDIEREACTHLSRGTEWLSGVVTHQRKAARQHAMV
jgi:hypothetical protein